jgi:hypothetical protein
MKKYPCPLGCSIQLTGMSNLRRHIREIHKNLLEGERLKVLKRMYAKGPRKDAWGEEMNEVDGDEPLTKKPRSTTIEKDQFVMFYAGNRILKTLTKSYILGMRGLLQKIYSYKLLTVPLEEAASGYCT